MKKLFLSIIIFFTLISVSWAVTPKIIPSADMTYLGAFKLVAPSGYDFNNSDSGGDSVVGMEYLPTDGKLIILLRGTDFKFYPSKYTIQTPCNWLIDGSCPNPASLPSTGLPTEGPVDITGGIQPGGGGVLLGDVHYLPAKGSQSTEKLYWSIYGGYTPEQVYLYARGQLGWADNNFDNFNVKGNWRFTGLTSNNNVRQTGKYLFHAPQDWADTYTDGKSLITGYYRSGSFGAIEGPNMVAFAPWLSCGGTPINCDTNPPPDAGGPAGTGDNEPTPVNSLPYQVLLKYGNTSSGNIITGKSVNDHFTSGRWIVLGSKQAIVFNGYQGARPTTWTYPATYYPAAISGDSEGYHDEPSSPVLWFFNVDDITAVAQGGNAYVPQPYRRVELTKYLFGKNIASMAYDETNGKLYIQEWISQYLAVIHVFQLTESASNTLDSTPPSTPSLALDSASHTSVTFHWATSTDDSGWPVIYRIYRNGQPIAVQTITSYTDSYLSFYPPPVEYTVKAVDFEGNVATSSPLLIDNTVSGNAPINIYHQANCPSACHETSFMVIRNDANNIPWYVKGGTAPYVWTIDPNYSQLPTGISIAADGSDSSIGRVTGSTSVAPGTNPYDVVVVVTDAAGNIAKRKTQIYVATSSYAASYYNDRDQDGVATGTDSDDLNSEVTPGMTYTQPAPTSLHVTSSTSNTVSLAWTSAATRTDPTYCQTYACGAANSRANEVGLDMTYEVYHGTSSGVYGTPVYVGRATSYTWTGLTSGINYFAVKAIEFRGLNSAYSNEAYSGIGTPINGSAFGAYYAEGWADNTSIAQASDGGIVIVGPTWSYSWVSGPETETSRGMLVKSSIDGVESWRRVFGPEGFNITTKQVGSTIEWLPTKVIVDGTNFIVIGTRANSSGTSSGFMTKFDSSGNEVWDHEYTDNVAYNYNFRDVVAKTGGGYAITGYGRGTSDTDAWLVFTDANGENPTDYFYNTNGKGFEVSNAIRKTSDGGYILSGYTQTGVTQDEDFYVVKVTSTGTLSWAQKYDNATKRDIAYSVEEDASGNFWIFGKSRVGTSETTSIWAVKVNSSGVQQSAYTVVSGTTGQAWIARKSIKLSSGNFLIIGYTNVSTGSGYHGYVTEINTSGVVQGTPATIGAVSGTVEDYFFDGVVSADGNYYLLAGNDNQSFSSAYDLWYIKMAVSDRSVQNITNCTKTTYFYDKDLDGLGNNYQWADPTADACFIMPGYVLNHSDNDDSIPGVLPTASGIQSIGVLFR